MLWTLFYIKFLYADTGDDAVGATEIDAGNDACGKQVIDTPVGLGEVGNLQMVGLPIGSDTRIALLTADGHHLETVFRFDAKLHAGVLDRLRGDLPHRPRLL